MSVQRSQAEPFEGSPNTSSDDAPVTYRHVGLAEPVLRDVRLRVARLLAEILRRELRALTEIP